MHSEEANSRGTKGLVRTSARTVSGLVPSTLTAARRTKKKEVATHALHPDHVDFILFEFFLLFESFSSSSLRVSTEVIYRD